MFLALELLCLLHLVFLEITLCLSGDCAWQSFLGPKPELVQFSKAQRFILPVSSTLGIGLNSKQKPKVT